MVQRRLRVRSWSGIRVMCFESGCICWSKDTKGVCSNHSHAPRQGSAPHMHPFTRLIINLIRPGKPSQGAQVRQHLTGHCSTHALTGHTLNPRTLDPCSHRPYIDRPISRAARPARPHQQAPVLCPPTAGRRSPCRAGAVTSPVPQAPNRTRGPQVPCISQAVPLGFGI